MQVLMLSSSKNTRIKKILAIQYIPRYPLNCVTTRINLLEGFIPRILNLKGLVENIEEFRMEINHIYTNENPHGALA